ncbi:unnamed protein product [Vicia faba]|uniref:Uncharacterized protein n=1 Tax=Vicia faba TaxID=3906 RepID=A0AAV1B0N7_VICFA|nr:unnamed protein product [Vicia faba]
MGFSLQWRKWMDECLRFATISVLVNGSPTGKFRVEKGLRQEDPLSPFLFLIVVEGLGMLLNKASEIGRFEGHSFGNQAGSLTHLQFADCTLILGPRSLENVDSMKAILHLFELSSDRKVNFHKIRLFGIKTSDSWLEEAAKALNFKVGSIPFIYLGLPVGANLRSIFTWDPVIDKVKKILTR